MRIVGNVCPKGTLHQNRSGSQRCHSAIVAISSRGQRLIASWDGLSGNLQKRCPHPSRQGASQRALFEGSTCKKGPRNRCRTPPRCRSLRSPLCRTSTSSRPPENAPETHAAIAIFARERLHRDNAATLSFNAFKTAVQIRLRGPQLLKRSGSKALFRVGGI